MSKNFLNKKIIAFIGFARSGKDVIGNHIVNNSKKYGKFKRIAFADKLKDVFCEEKKITRKFLEENKNELRSELVKLGEDRRAEDINYWINKVKEELEYCEENVIITDLRRIAEVDYLLSLKRKGYDVKIYHIFRPLINGGLFENDKDTALTIVYLDFYTLIELKIINDATESELINKIENII